MALINLFCNFKSAFRQMDVSFRADGNITVLTKILHCHADAWLLKVHLIGDVDRAHVALSLIHISNNIRMGAMQYTDDILRNLENTISHSMDAAKARHDAYVSSLQGFLDVVTANRAELNPTAEEPETKTTDAQASQADGPKVEISSDMLG